MAGNVAPNMITDGLVLCLDAANPKSFVSGSTTWNDLTTNFNNGTLVNGPTFDSGNGGSIVFDGIDDYGIINGNNLTKQLNQITVECFFNKSSGRTILSHSNDTIGAVKSYAFEQVSNSFQSKLNISSVQYTLSHTDLNNKWNMISLTYDGSLITLYHNGVFITSTPAAGSVTYQTNSNLNIGRKNSADGEYINGRISNIRLYNRSLTANEVLQNYNTIKTRFGL